MNYAQKLGLDFYLDNIEKQPKIFDLIIESKNKSLLKFHMKRVCLHATTESTDVHFYNHLKSFESLVDTTSDGKDIDTLLTFTGHNLIKHIILLEFYNSLHAMTNQNKGLSDKLFKYIDSMNLCDITDYEHPYLNEWIAACN